MSQNNTDSAWEHFWTDRPLEDQMMMVGQWAERFPGKFDAAWLEFEEDVLKPTDYHVKNAWAMDRKRQQIFADYLESSNDDFQAWLDERFNEACEAGWDVGSVE